MAAVKATVVTFLRGAGWLAAGWRLFRAAPFAWLVIVFLYWLTMALLGTVPKEMPKIGLAIGVTLIPVFSVGFMAASRSSARDQTPGLAEMLSGFREAFPAQLALGTVYLALLSALLWATTLADDGVLVRWLLTGEKPSLEILLSPEFSAALMVAAIGYAPVVMLFWFAPVLVAWHGMHPAKALFFSFAACLVNWRAFTGYGIASTLLTVVLPTMVLGVLLVGSGGKLAPVLERLLLPLVLFLLPMLYGSFFASYRDVFGTPAAAAEREPPPQ